MSPMDVDGQTQALSGPARTAGRSGANGQANADDGAFGAAMAALDAPPAEVKGRPGKATAEGAGETTEGSADAAGAEGDTPQKASLDDLLSRLLAGAKEGETRRAASGTGKDQPAGEMQAQQVVDDIPTETDAASVAALDDEALLHAATKSAARAQQRARADDAATGDATSATLQPAAAEAQAALQAAARAANTAETAQTDADAADTQASLAALSNSVQDTPLPDTGDTVMRVKVLSRETHFAPVTDWSLPSEVGAGTQAKAADPTSAGGDEDSSEAGTDRGEAFATSARERASVRLEQSRAQADASAGEGSAQASLDTGEADAGLAATSASDGTSWSGTVQPSLPLASLRQVSTAIGAELARMADPTPSQTSADAQTRTGGPLRLLDIQLNPSDLGTVTVRMRLSDQGLDVRISASNPATARMLQADQARLGDLLKSQGIEGANVTVVDPTDQSGAWGRFEIMSRPSTGTLSGQGGGERSSGQQPGQQNSGNGRNEGEDASGGRRSGRNNG